MNGYTVVTASNTHELEAKVKNLMNLGWVLAGGVASSDRTGSFYQAMSNPVTGGQSTYFGPG